MASQAGGRPPDPCLYRFDFKHRTDVTRSFEYAQEQEMASQSQKYIRVGNLLGWFPAS